MLLERREFMGRNGRVVAELNHHFSLPISPMVTIEKSFRKLSET